MEVKKDFIEPLLQKVEDYGKTSLKIVQLKSIEKITVISASLITRLLLITAISFFVLVISIALGLWLGELLGKNYYGFLLLGLFYAFVIILLLLIQPFLKIRIGNFIVTQLLNGNK